MDDDRKFLHDLSSPLASAVFIADIFLEKFKENAAGDPKGLDLALKLQLSLEKVMKMIEIRRQELHAIKP